MSDQKYQPDFIKWYEPEFWADPHVNRGMTWMQRLLYRALTQAALFCSTRPYLPADDNQLWLLADAGSPQNWLDNKDPVLVKFHKVTIDGVEYWAHKRLLSEWEYILEVAEAKRRGGKARAQQRFNSSSAPDNSSSAHAKHALKQPLLEVEGEEEGEVDGDKHPEHDSCPWCSSNPCKHPSVCENRRVRAGLNSDTPASSTKPAPRVPTRKLGFDPYSVEPFDGWTAVQIAEVVRYHWEYLPTTEEEPFWRDKTNTEDFFKRNFSKMAEQVKPIPDKKPARKTEPVQRINDPNCAVCHGKGIDALRPCNLCACVRFKNEAGEFVSYYDWMVLNKKTNKHFEEDFAKEIPLYKTLGLPEVVHA